MAHVDLEIAVQFIAYEIVLIFHKLDQNLSVKISLLKCWQDEFWAKIISKDLVKTSFDPKIITKILATLTMLCIFPSTV